MITYDQIKQLAVKEGVSVTNLIALARQNDPFYWVGLYWAGRERPVVCQPVAAAGPEPVEGFGYSDGVHLRRIHYQLVSQDPPVVKSDGKPYENTTNDWGYLFQASKAARYLNLVNPAAFVDRRNPDPHLRRLYLGSSDPWVDITGDWRGDFDVTLPDFELYGHKPRQPYHLEIWCEKTTTMNDVLLPLCRQYGVKKVYKTGRGL